MGSLSRNPELVAEGGEEKVLSLLRHAKASMQPVMIPGDAVRRLTEIAVRHLGTPRPSAASRMVCGTVAASPVVRVIVGTIMMARATPLASAEKSLMITMSE